MFAMKKRTKNVGIGNLDMFLSVEIADLFFEHQFVDFAVWWIDEELKGGYRCLSLWWLNRAKADEIRFNSQRWIMENFPYISVNFTKFFC